MQRSYITMDNMIQISWEDKEIVKNENKWGANLNNSKY